MSAILVCWHSTTGFQLDFAYFGCAFPLETHPLNPTSPAGSPTGGGAANDGAELARRMILATEAAATAASQAVKAFEDLMPHDTFLPISKFWCVVGCVRAQLEPD